MAPILDHLFNSSGRIGRKTFAISVASFIAFGVACTLLPIAGQIVSLAMLWPWTVVAIKRLRDMDRGGMMAVVLAIATASLWAVGSFAALFTLNPGQVLLVASVLTIATLIVGLAAIAFIVWLAITPGSPHFQRPASFKRAMT